MPVAVTSILQAVFVDLGIHTAYAFHFGTRKFGLYNAAMSVLVIAAILFTL